MADTLSLHLGKTESILFGSPQKIKFNPSLEITCNNLAIKSTTIVKYVDATLYQTLSLSEMAQSLLKKANARFKFFTGISSIFLNKLKQPLVMSLMQCHYEYACCIWCKGLEKQTSNYS